MTITWNWVLADIELNSEEMQKQNQSKEENRYRWRTAVREVEITDSDGGSVKRRMRQEWSWSRVFCGILERERDSIGVFFLGLRRRRRRRSDYGRYFHFWPLYIGTNETDPARFLWSVKCPNISMSRSRITNMPLFDFYFFFSNTNYNLQNYWIL